MREIGVLEARTNFSHLIAEVERTGEAVTVTRHGRAAVRIVPAVDRTPLSPDDRRRRAAEIFRLQDSMTAVPGFDDRPWEELKRIARDEDRFD